MIVPGRDMCKPGRLLEDPLVSCILCVCVTEDVCRVFGGFEVKGRAFPESWCVIKVFWVGIVVVGLVEFWLIWRGRGKYGDAGGC